MKTLVIYHSRDGHTRAAAEAIAEAARKLNNTVTVKSVAEVLKHDVDSADTIFVGTWVHGLILFGVRPADADRWVPNLPAFQQKPVGVFCTYAFNPRSSLKMLGSLLIERGAVIKGEHAFHRNNPAAGADQFVRSVLHRD